MYFSLQRVASAIDHLADYPSPWVIVPLVFAVNGVKRGEFVKLTGPGKAGTDSGFLANHFSGALMGLPPFPNGKNALRPRFSDISASVRAGDRVCHQKQGIWGNAMSRYGYRVMEDQGLVERDDSGAFRLTDKFKETFEDALGTEFRFEELLIWLYAFEGFPADITGWEQLLEAFQEKYLGPGGRFEEDYRGRFRVSGDVPWPDELLETRPANEVYQRELMPSSCFDTSMADALAEDLEATGLSYPSGLPRRLLASLLTRRFLIMTGLSGSGKTKLALALARWIAKTPSQYVVVSVGADWTGSDSILGYPDALDKSGYVRTPALDLILEASAHPELPYLLILDEMNLSHVEKYFADILSALESGEAIHLHDTRGPDALPATRNGVPCEVFLPANLFVLGTVNVDESTYMFSPKVLDRAQVLEFRVQAEELASFLTDPGLPDLHSIVARGSRFSKDFLSASQSDALLDDETRSKVATELLLFFEVMAQHWAEFGFRTASEVARFVFFHRRLSPANWSFDEAMDALILQKLLPKIHGSRKAIEPLLCALAACCFKKRAWKDGSLQNIDEIRNAARVAASINPASHPLGVDDKGLPRYPQDQAQYPLSFSKILRMLVLLDRDGFAGFAEA